jgi:hypothetical protein
LEIVRALSATATCIAAGDAFQDLNETGENDAVAWARESGDGEELLGCHRTSASGLLEAANALRSGRALPTNGNGFTVLGARNVNVGASYVSKNLTWWRDGNDIAVITPVRAETSPFVRDLLARVEDGPISDPPVGPHRIPWEASQEDECNRFLEALGLPNETSAEVQAADLPACGGSGPSRALHRWLERQRRVAGRTSFLAGEIREQVRRIHQRSRAYRRTRDRGVRAMTIHQAKNREFDSVIVLWPYKVAACPDRQRRLLYNAITRAKLRVLVVVQNPKRLQQPPFVAES